MRLQQPHRSGSRYDKFVTPMYFGFAYLIDWADEEELIADFPNLSAYLERMYARPSAPPRIAQAFASLQAAT